MGEFSPDVVKCVNRGVYKDIRESIRDYSSRVQAACNFAVDVMDWLQEHHPDRPPYYSRWGERIELGCSSVSIFIYLNGECSVVRKWDSDRVDLGHFASIDIYKLNPDIWLGNFESLIPSIEGGTQ